MKKIFSIVIVMILLLCGCGKNETNEYMGVNLGIEEKSNVRKTNLEDVVITDEVAIDIGNAVMKSIYGEEIFKDTEYSLTYYKLDAAYVFTRIPIGTRGSLLGTPYCEIIISKINGAVLGLWQE